MTTITIIDARTVDGDAYEAAEAAVVEAARALAAADKALDVAYILARNAGMQRQIDLDGEPDAAQWSASVEAGKLVTARKGVRSIVKTLAPVRKAVAFNPKDAA